LAIQSKLLVVRRLRCTCALSSGLASRGGLGSLGGLGGLRSLGGLGSSLSGRVSRAV
jgi:hypothetical protein